MHNKFICTWVTQTQLGEQFGLTAGEIGRQLIRLDLRYYDTAQRLYLPTTYALTEGLSILTPLKQNKTFSMWHFKKVAQLLQEHLALQPLSELDVWCRRSALYLVAVLREAERGHSSAYNAFVATLPYEYVPAVLAWALVETYRRRDRLYASLLDRVCREDLATLDIELERLDMYKQVACTKIAETRN